MVEAVEPRNNVPSIEQAEKDWTDFDTWTAQVTGKKDMGELDKRVQALANKALELGNQIIKDAGKIPPKDKRHQVFAFYNQILEKWERLLTLS